MDHLIDFARTWSSSLWPRPYPVKGRLAYVVAHGLSYASNGYAVRTHRIAQALASEGFDVYCFVQPGRPWDLDDDISVAPVVRIDQVTYVHSPGNVMDETDSSPARFDGAASRLLGLFRLYRPQAVIAASDWKSGLPAWAAARRLRIPFFNEVRGFWELSEAARRPEYQHQPEYALGIERDSFVAQNALEVFTLNQLMKAELISRGVAGDKIQVVPNGVLEIPEDRGPASSREQRQESLRSRLGIRQDDQVVGYVGSFNVYEGLDVLIEACRHLVEQGNPIKLVLVGDDQPVTQWVSSLEVSHSMKPWLIEVGRIPHEEIDQYYALLDVVVIARKAFSVCQLVPPMKIIEALAYRKRVVVSDVPPLAEYAAMNPHVLACEAGNSHALAHAIKQAFSQEVADGFHCSMFIQNNLKPMVNALRRL